MNKIYTLLALVGFAGSAWAQCIPDASNTTDLIYPAPQDLNTDLEVGVNYDQTITVNVPSDTTVSIGPITQTIAIDSININSITGVPSGLNYQCQNTRCSTPGGGQGCVSIFGTPDQAGTYTATLNFTVHTPIVTLPQSESVTFEVLAGDSAGGGNGGGGNGGGSTYVSEISPELLNLSVYPNPTNSSSTLRFYLLTQESVNITVFNLVGAEMYQSYLLGNSGTNAIALPSQEWPAGYYMVSFVINGQRFSEKLTIVR